MGAAVLTAALVASAAAAGSGGRPYDAFVHGSSPLQSLSTSAPIAEPGPGLDAAHAARFALIALEAHGVDSVSICEVHRIEAPLTGYLFDALGVLERDGCIFTTFRVGVRDGLEQTGDESAAGEEFVFIARGVDDDGVVRWLPSPGPDALPGGGDDPGALLEYEFLLWREDFESLATRYPSP